MEHSFPEYRIISTETMISTMQESNRNNERFCFILGSGASVESGIPTGTELEKRWMEFLMGKSADEGTPPKDPEDVREYAKKLKEAHQIKHDFSEIEKNWEEVQKGERSSLSSKYYFDLCTLRFYPNYKNSYRYFERLMESKEPSIGYRVLAELLTHKNNPVDATNNLVVTTNFDSLTEDALFLYTDKKPLVINHESLADYISDPSITRPIIAKIHRGLLFTPLNSINDTDRLKKEWEKVLSTVFKTYTPIVIGYGGGDHSLMDFLHSDRVELNQGIYWCYLSKYGLPNEKIQELVENKDGYFVSIEGFDAFMTAIGSQLCPDNIGPVGTNKFLNDRYQSRIDTYTKRWNELKSLSQQAKNMRDSELDAEKEREESKSLTYFDYFHQGTRFMEDKVFDQAIGCFNKSIELKKDFMPTYNNRGNAYSSLGQYKKAIEDYNRALELNPNVSEAYNNRGNAYSDLGQYKEAIKDYNKAIELSPNGSKVYYNRGIAYSDLGQYKEAIKDYNKAIELNPNGSKVYNNRGNAYSDLGKYREAIEDYNRALELNPNDSEAYNNRGNAYSDLGKYREAIEDYNKALELNPNDSEVYYNRGIAYSDLGQYKEAIKDYNRALELNPNDSEAYNNRGNAYSDLGKYREAIKDYNKALELNPNGSKVYYNRGVSYSNLGQYKEAIEDYNKALELNPNDSEVYYNRGNAYFKLGQHKEAIEDYNKAIELNPNDSEAYNNRGNAYSDLGKYREAIEDYNKALELNPNDSDVYNNRGSAYSDLGKYEETIEDYNRVLELNPKLKTAYIGRAKAYRALGEIELAEADEQKAASILEE